MAVSTQSLLKSKSFPYILVVVLGVSAIAYALVAGHTALEKVLLAVRYTARFALLPFILIFCASSLVRLWPNPITASLMRNRFYWGTAYALAMAIQAAAFMFLFFMPEYKFPGPIIMGLLNYFMIFGMVLTPLKAAARAGTLSRIKRFHKVGMYWCWFTFTAQYGFYATHGIRPVLSEIMVLICVAMLGVRIASWTKMQLKKFRPMAAVTNA